MVTSIGNYVFNVAGTTQLTITLGNVTPTVGIEPFLYVTSPKPVTVIVPADATGYGNSPTNPTENNWGNAFRGRGWDGTNYLSGTVNSNINLSIVRQ